ncbi:hypothetical protein ACO2Q8_04075 [Larkinella sp. VNQ87]|uniref:hypothetical protein n=1 Tax=Larkinella sp. VNQ87 TaxID=3400921 RepID=UPI003C11A308
MPPDDSIWLTIRVCADVTGDRSYCLDFEQKLFDDLTTVLLYHDFSKPSLERELGRYINALDEPDLYRYTFEFEAERQAPASTLPFFEDLAQRIANHWGFPVELHSESVEP